MKKTPALRHLVVVLGDQLAVDSSAFDGFDPRQDAVWMAEVAGEATQVWSHQARIALFLSAMRHFRELLRARNWPVHYRELTERGNTGALATELTAALQQLRPARVILVEPGEWRLKQELSSVVKNAGLPLELREDRHFLASRADFAAHAAGRKQLRMEFFYREMRRRYQVLMAGDQPVGGAWNFDAENRSSFGPGGPIAGPEPVAFPPDALTREVLAMVAKQFARHPGELTAFDWPVTREQGLAALQDFIQHRLPHFGQFQDAMWLAEGDLLGAVSPRRQTYLFHSRLAAAMNLKLIHPREIIAAAEAAYTTGKVDLPGVEGFIRQILGWREYVRGVYWHFMPDYL